MCFGCAFVTFAAFAVKVDPSAATLAAAGHTVGMEAVGGLGSHSRRGRADMHINDIMYKYLLP